MKSITCLIMIAVIFLLSSVNASVPDPDLEALLDKYEALAKKMQMLTSRPQEPLDQAFLERTELTTQEYSNLMQMTREAITVYDDLLEDKQCGLLLSPPGPDIGKGAIAMDEWMEAGCGERLGNKAKKALEAAKKREKLKADSTGILHAEL